MTYLLIDVGLGLTALIVGVVGTLLYTRHSAAAAPDGSATGSDLEQQQTYQNERAAMAAQSLRDLAENMASDVGAHCQLMDGISVELGAIPTDSANGKAVNSAVARIVSANSDLHGRLEEAERKIAAQAEEIRTQQSEARTDSLTQLPNRRAFDDAVRKNLATFRDEARPFSLMIFDVDHFKKFNDTHGHQAGDEVLRQVGSTLKKVVKSGDVPCRYGGEEFAVVMPNTRAKDARVAADRVRLAIDAMEIHFEGKQLHVTASMGVAQIAPKQDSKELIRHADDAVYASKNAGRNCGHWHTGEACLPLDKDPEKPQAPPKAEPKASPKAVGAEAAGNGFGNRYRKLPDQRVLLDELSRRISESQRFGVPLSVVRMHVADFEKLEAEYGEAVGDLILDSVVSFTRGSLRDMDLLARLRRGEFAVLLPATNRNDALAVGRRVSSALASAPLPIGGKEVRLTVELGAAAAKAGEAASSLLGRAGDDYQYAAAEAEAAL